MKPRVEIEGYLLNDILGPYAFDSLYFRAFCMEFLRLNLI